MSYVPNTRGVKIKTPNGYESFKGIRKVTHDSHLKISFTDGTEIGCSLDHRIRVTNGRLQWWEFARNLDPTSMAALNAFTGKCVRINSITPISGTVELYDIVGAGKDYCFFSNGIISHNCEFMGSSNTLVNSYTISNLPIKKPIFEYQGYQVFIPPKPGHSYVVTVDVSHGKGLDYQAFSVIDISEFPYDQVASFYNADMSPLLYPSVISKVGTDYNMAWLLVENNDMGAQVINILNYDLEYENIVSPQTESGKYTDGLRTTPRTKSIGCSTMRDLLESSKLLVRDNRLKEELIGFGIKGSSYAAEEGYHDDLVMGLVNFSYLTTTDEFKNLNDHDIRNALFEQRMQDIEEDLCAFALCDDGTGEEDQSADLNERFGLTDDGITQW